MITAILVVVSATLAGHAGQAKVASHDQYIVLNLRSYISIGTLYSTEMIASLL